MRKGIEIAREERELRKYLEQTAYSYLKENETWEITLTKIKELNSNSDTPLADGELEEIVTSADADRRNKKIKKTDKIYYTADFPELCDLVFNEELKSVSFLTFDRELLGVYQKNEINYQPPIQENIQWLLPRAQAVLEEAKKHTDSTDSSDTEVGVCPHCVESLYPEVWDYFQQFSDLPTQKHYDFLTLMAFHSHLIEKFNFSPLLFLVAVKDRGKTPTLKALSAISRRGIFTETFREPNLIRWSSDYKASLFFDVRDFPKKVKDSNCDDLIYGRAERGVTSSRVLFPEKGAFQDMVNFSVFGVTGATSNKMVDEITEARCVVFNMPYSDRVFNIEPTRELGLPLKEKLTAFRLAHFRKPFVSVPKEKPGKIENYMRGFQSMVRTLFSPLESEFLDFKTNLLKQKAEETETTTEGKLLRAILTLQDKVEYGSVTLTHEIIADHLNLGVPERYHFSNESIGRHLREMGFELKRNSDGTKRGIYFDTILINKLIKQYGFNDEKIDTDTPSNASELSGVSGNNQNTLIGYDDD